jgi:hypothetical protein
LSSSQWLVSFSAAHCVQLHQIVFSLLRRLDGLGGAGGFVATRSGCAAAIESSGEGKGVTAHDMRRDAARFYRFLRRALWDKKVPMDRELVNALALAMDCR